jgi:phage terminase large subunit-like protein
MKSPTVVMPDGVPVPRIRHAPKNVRHNAWEDVVELAGSYGLKLDPWQENVLEGAMGERADGFWAAKQVGLSCPRQNGKGAILEARALAGLLLFNEKLIIHSAHELATARIGFTRIMAYFENYDDLRRKVGSKSGAYGREYIRLRSGQELRFVTRSKAAIRGFSADCLLLDEGQILEDAAWEAILYTVSARPQHQIWLVGTPPLTQAEGIIFDRFRARGVEGKDHRSCWFEWSAEPGSDLDDPRCWAQANPALGSGQGSQRVTYDNVIAERSVASDEGFARERLGMWSESSVARVISADSWAVCANPGLVDAGREVCFAVDVAPDRGSASIAAASWTSDGSAFVDVVETRRGEPDWGVEKVAGMCGRHDVRAVVIDAAGPAVSLVDALRQRGITVTVTTSRQMAAACANFYDNVMDGTMRHLDQPWLNVALSVARKRMIGDTGWGWSRKDSGSDITPVTAATLALWGLTSSEVAEQPRRRSGIAVFA